MTNRILIWLLFFSAACSNDASTERPAPQEVVDPRPVVGTYVSEETIFGMYFPLVVTTSTKERASICLDSPHFFEKGNLTQLSELEYMLRTRMKIEISSGGITRIGSINYRKVQGNKGLDAFIVRFDADLPSPYEVGPDCDSFVEDVSGLFDYVSSCWNDSIEGGRICTLRPHEYSYLPFAGPVSDQVFHAHYSTSTKEYALSLSGSTQFGVGSWSGRAKFASITESGDFCVLEFDTSMTFLKSFMTQEFCDNMPNGILINRAGNLDGESFE